MNELVMIEFDRHRPFSVWYKNERGWVDLYDVDYCKRDDTLYYHISGGGELYLEQPGRHKYWIATGYSVKEACPENRVRRLNPRWKAEIGTTWGVESDTEYCEICRDNIPLIDPCEHITGYDDPEAL
jgi:hypothetical protein